jgi:threonine/homoserine/homoserine lactone efflux protein
MNLALTGVVLGLAVSIPPGPNSMLCMNLACGGVRRAVPLITSAALTDAAYSLLAASGVLFASHASSAIFAYLAPCVMIGTAVLIWSPRWTSPTAAAGIALFNPATAAIWIGLSSAPSLRALSPADILARTLPVAFGTAVWFTLLAIAASRFSHRVGSQHTTSMQKALSVTLGILGLLSLLALLP